MVAATYIAMMRAARLLLRQPTILFSTLLLFILGAGATTIMFAIVNAVILNPLPYKDPNRLVKIVQHAKGIPGTAVLEPLADAWATNSTLCSIATWRSSHFTLLYDGQEPERVIGARVSSNFLSLLGVLPQIGSMAVLTGDRSGSAGFAVLTDSFWRNSFHQKTTAIGKSINLNGKQYTVVGVLPSTFRFPAADTPGVLIFGNHVSKPGVLDFVQVIGRLKAGRSAEAAAKELLAISEHHYSELPAFIASQLRSSAVHISGLADSLFSRLRPPVMLLFATVICIFLLASVNVAHLHFIRAISRQREMAIRFAVGADMKHLLQMLAAEGAVLSLFGGLGGLGVAFVGISALRNVPQLAAEAPELHLSLLVVLFCTLLTGISGIAVTVMPPYLTYRRTPALSTVLKAGSDFGAPSKISAIRRLVIGFEVALSACLLLISAGLISEFLSILHTDPGFNPNGILAAQVHLPHRRYPGARQQGEFVHRLVDAMNSRRGVLAASAASALPLGGYSFMMPIHLVGEPSSSTLPLVPVLAVTPGYLRTLGIPLLRGEMFSTNSAISPEAPVLINARLAKDLFHGRNSLNRRVMLGSSGPFVILGIFGNVHHLGLTQRVPPEILVPFGRYPSPYFAIAVRSSVDPRIVRRQLSTVVRHLDSRVPLSGVSTMDQRISDSLQPRRLQSILIMVFGLSALALSIIGIYAMVAYSIQQQKRSIGIRLALGANPGNIIVGILLNTLRPAAAGLIAGIFMGEAVRRGISGMAYGTPGFEAIPILATSVAVSLGVAAAVILPAIRIARVDPATTLRYE
ncbi:MAG: ABC transporter permease [Terriglobia bacterium]